MMNMKPVSQTVQTRDQFGFPLALSYELKEEGALYYLVCRSRGQMDKESVCGPFGDRAEALAFLETAAAYTVTPETLSDVFLDNL